MRKSLLLAGLIASGTAVGAMPAGGGTHAAVLVGRVLGEHGGRGLPRRAASRTIRQQLTGAMSSVTIAPPISPFQVEPCGRPAAASGAVITKSRSQTSHGMPPSIGNSHDAPRRCTRSAPCSSSSRTPPPTLDLDMQALGNRISRAPSVHSRSCNYGAQTDQESRSAYPRAALTSPA